MLRKLNLLFVSILLTLTYGYSQSGLGTIRGSVIDKESKEFIPNSVITVKQNGSVRGNATTDFDGKFQINSLVRMMWKLVIREKDTKQRLSKELWFLLTELPF
jgi:hypothetical protein